MDINEMTKKRQSLIDLKKGLDSQLSLFNDLTDEAKKARSKEIQGMNESSRKLSLDIAEIDEQIQVENDRLKAVEIERNNQAFVADFLSKHGVSVSNWLEFITAYEETTKVMKSKKIKFDKLSDEVIKTESENNANTISGWFSALDFSQKTCDESVFNTVNKMVGKRLKQGNVKNSLIDFWQENPESIDELDKKELSRVVKFIISRSAVRTPSVSTGPRKTREGSVKAQVDSYLDELGEGTHSLSDYISFYRSISTGTTKPESQLVMCCRADKNGKYAVSMNKNNDEFTLTLR